VLFNMFVRKERPELGSDFEGDLIFTEDPEKRNSQQQLQMAWKHDLLLDGGWIW